MAKYVALCLLRDGYGAKGSVFLGPIGRTARPIDTIGAPIWLADPALQRVDESKPLKDTDPFRVRSVPGVKWEVPVLMRQVQMLMPDGRYHGVRLIGLDAGSLAGMPAIALQGEIGDVKSPDAIVLGTAELHRIGDPEVGAAFQINDRLARVAVILETGMDVLSNPYVFTTLGWALSYTQSQSKQLSFVLAAPGRRPARRPGSGSHSPGDRGCAHAKSPVRADAEMATTAGFLSFRSTEIA